MAKRTKNQDAARQLAIDAATLARDSHCSEIVILDLRGISQVTNYFVICTGTSSRQMRSVADDIAVHGKEIGQRVWKKAGMDVGDWILLDFVDVVVHLFDPKHRRYYDLELIWGGAPRVEWDSSPATPKED